MLEVYFDSQDGDQTFISVSKNVRKFCHTCFTNSGRTESGSFLTLPRMIVVFYAPILLKPLPIRCTKYLILCFCTVATSLKLIRTRCYTATIIFKIASPELSVCKG